MLSLITDIALTHIAGRGRQTLVSILGVALGVGFSIAMAALMQGSQDEFVTSLIDALPHVDIAKPQKVVGTNTVECIQSGVFWGYVGLVKEVCARIKGERDRGMQVIATGGLAPLFQQDEALFDALEEDLTMHGLTVIHRYNKDNGN